MVWIGIGCGVLFVGVIAFVGFIVFVVFGSMRSIAPYRTRRARATTRVIAALGTRRAGIVRLRLDRRRERERQRELDDPARPKGSARICTSSARRGAGGGLHADVIVTAMSAAGDRYDFA